MRFDIREALERAARDELEFNGHYICLVSRDVAESGSKQWTKNVQLKFDPDASTGLVDIIVQEMEL